MDRNEELEAQNAAQRFCDRVSAAVYCQRGLRLFFASNMTVAGFDEERSSETCSLCDLVFWIWCRCWGEQMIGTPAKIKEQLMELQSTLNVHEFVCSTIIQDYDRRIHAYELLAENILEM